MPSHLHHPVARDIDQYASSYRALDPDPDPEPTSSIAQNAPKKPRKTTASNLIPSPERTRVRKQPNPAQFNATQRNSTHLTSKLSSFPQQKPNTSAHRIAVVRHPSANTHVVSQARTHLPVLRLSFRPVLPKPAQLSSAPRRPPPQSQQRQYQSSWI
ncbi:hypothetical protein BDV95DRAFT_593651 [Massariosphaeria phaeospora]|uniref:Uncharacterized protein n=1 Tax=Massariosphaeria phaeospora TaxID=100035 RepID=A0A7C8MAR3_9PLEO|nr:hypothetical protein BDV95DRAFT_593651 [Massariosphaeria phaeospora]